MKCGNCGRLVENFPDGKIGCPHCGFRMLFKPRSEVVRKVRAR